MSELSKIFLTSGLTIFGGVVVYILGQIISKFLIEPIHEQKKIITEISDVLIFYANQFYLYERFDPKAEEVSNKIRSLSTQLKAKTNFIPFYIYLEKLKIVLSKKDISGACRALIGLSNSVYKSQGQSVSHVESYKTEIINKLNIEIW